MWAEDHASGGTASCSLTKTKSVRGHRTLTIPDSRAQVCDGAHPGAHSNWEGFPEPSSVQVCQ
eukprot:1388324-Amphidinium_carterae.1